MGNLNCCSATSHPSEKEILSGAKKDSEDELASSSQEEHYGESVGAQKGKHDFKNTKKKRMVYSGSPSNDETKSGSNGTSVENLVSEFQLKHYDSNSQTTVSEHSKASHTNLPAKEKNNRDLMGGDPENPLQAVVEEPDENNTTQKDPNTEERVRSLEFIRKETLSINKHAPSAESVTLLKQTPPEKLKILDEFKLNPFIFDFDDLEDPNLPFLGPFLMTESNAVYRGQWKNQYRHGKGEQFFANGSYYIGYWKNDMAHGKGRLVHPDKSYYEGSWLNDKAHSYGVFVSANGSKYKGEWYQDKKHGKGAESWADGTSYEGEYLNGKKHGTGVFRWGDGSIYKGSFYNDNIQGFGEYIWANGKYFKGTWKDNKMHGSGEFKWADGKRFVGEYVDDEKQGYGEFEWPDGRIYKGNWFGGKQHGTGMFTDSKGKARKGEWNQGKHIKWIS